jgi:hypothetical protein
MVSCKLLDSWWVGPMDGTFDQLRPILRLLKRRDRMNLPLYSLDLSSATDRLPVKIQARILDYVFNQYSGVQDFGQRWKALLTDRVYTLSSDKYETYGEFKYSVGQPMGALSSWAMLAVTHHLIVQVAAWRTGHTLTRLFTDYAILGDDIVIANKKVRDEYLRILSIIGVECGLHKSIMSPKGLGLEFAKKTFIRGHNISPLSWKELSTALKDISSWSAFSHTWNLSLVRQYRILGHGYKARNAKFNKLNHACQLVYLTNCAKVDLNTEFLSVRSSHKSTFDHVSSIFFYKMVLPKFIELLKLKDFFLSLTLKNRKTMLSTLKVKPHLEPYIMDTMGAWIKEDRKNALEKIDKLINSFQAEFLLLTSWPGFQFWLNKYIEIINLTTQFDKDSFLVKPIRIETSSKFPFQIKLFREWSKAAISLTSLYRKYGKLDKSLTIKESVGYQLPEMASNFSFFIVKFYPDKLRANENIIIMLLLDELFQIEISREKDE